MDRADRLERQYRREGMTLGAAQKLAELAPDHEREQRRNRQRRGRHALRRREVGDLLEWTEKVLEGWPTRHYLGRRTIRARIVRLIEAGNARLVVESSKGVQAPEVGTTLTRSGARLAKCNARVIRDERPADGGAVQA